MKRFYALAFLPLVLGCSKPSEPASNAATEYVDSLAMDKRMAEEAKETADRAIKEMQETLATGQPGEPK